VPVEDDAGESDAGERCRPKTTTGPTPGAVAGPSYCAGLTG
jgi:hypothetical protein